ncbi:MAG: helix-turn-helix transcriptional regulator [Ruminiclostridium sp.]|nr:helix-turn-helix transcriptional regulator [Ruminiclostridium sp.]MBQ8842005.1 helix-turn-helix transcriptional regulator [Ruminiclostridium sp.]
MLNENIKNCRKNKGLTQEEVAVRLNVVRQTVSKWEKGYSVPDAEMLKKIADLFETDVSKLLGSTIETKENTDEIAEQLSRINEQLIIKNKRSRRIWKIIGISLLSILVINIILAICGAIAFNSLTFSEETVVEEGMVEYIEEEAEDSPQA